jgi:hypothetical protein
MLYGCRKGWLGFNETIKVASFLCGHSMSYDISISVLKKTFIKTL